MASPTKLKPEIQNLNKALIQAVIESDLKSIKEKLKEGANINCMDTSVKYFFSNLQLYKLYF